MQKNKNKSFSFGVRNPPKAYIYANNRIGSFLNGRFTFPDSEIGVLESDITKISYNPTHKYLKCIPEKRDDSKKYDSDDFDIVEDGDKWNCRHKYCRDINCNEPKLGYYPVYPENDDFIAIPNNKYWDYETKELKNLPKYRYYDGKTVTELLYDPVKKNRCVRKSWDGRCLEYVCKDCYNCDTRTGQCLDTFLSKAACAAKKIKYKKGENEIPGCNYESFTEGYTDR